MSASVNPIAGPTDRTTALMAAFIFSPLICCHLVDFLKIERGVLLVDPWRRKYPTRQRMAAIIHLWGWPVCPCPIDSPLMPFFWVVKRRLSKLAWESTVLDTVADL